MPNHPRGVCLASVADRNRVGRRTGRRWPFTTRWFSPSINVSKSMVKDIRDKALALEEYARQACNIEAERKAADIRIRAERNKRLQFAIEKTWASRPETCYTLDVKEESEAKDPDQEARDQQRGERFRQEDEDCGVGASQEADRRQREARRTGLDGLVARKPRPNYLGF